MSEEQPLTQRDVESLRVTIDKLDRTLNALPREMAAIYVRTDVLEPRLKNIEAEVKEHGDWLTWAQRIVIGAVILALISLIIYTGGARS